MNNNDLEQWSKGAEGDFGGVQHDIAAAAPPDKPPLQDEVPGSPILPEGCPVTPLGHKGGTYYYIDSAGQFRELIEREHARLYIEGLFNRGEPWLREHFQTRNKGPEGSGKIACEVIGWKLRQACTAKGVWDPASKMRGTGAWSDGSGGLVLHCGDAVYRSEGDLWSSVGEIGAHVYPAMPPGPRPLGGAVAAGMDGPAGKLLAALQSWSFERGAIDERLMIGWIAAAMLGGALKWRPAVWVTGDKGTGKSTLLELTREVLGGAAVVTSDATAAGIWQHVGHTSLPVILDEQEAEEDNRRNTNILNLARQASSGGVVLRGGANHQGSEFTARSCFLFSSILMPPMQPQDRSRMAVLELGTLRGGGPEPELSPRHWGPIGRGLRRLLIQGWGRFEATRSAYFERLMQLGHEARGADQFGTLLAAADLLLSDTLPDERRLGHWTMGLVASELSETADSAPDWRQCLDHVLEHQLDTVEGGARLIVQEWAIFAEDEMKHRLRPVTPPKDPMAEEEMDLRSKAEKALARAGLRVFVLDGETFLAIANTHKMLSQVFRDSKWMMVPGAQRSGWMQALSRVPGVRTHQLRVAGKSTRCKLVPWALVTGDGDDEGLAAKKDVYDDAECDRL